METDRDKKNWRERERKKTRATSATSKRVSLETFPRIQASVYVYLAGWWTRVMDGRGRYLTKSACKLSWSRAGRGHADGLYGRLWPACGLSYARFGRVRAGFMAPTLWRWRIASRAEGPKADLSQRVSKPRPGHRLPQPERSSSWSTVESPSTPE